MLKLNIKHACRVLCMTCSLHVANACLTQAQQLTAIDAYDKDPAQAKRHTWQHCMSKSLRCDWPTSDSMLGPRPSAMPAQHAMKTIMAHVHLHFATSCSDPDYNLLQERISLSMPNWRRHVTTKGCVTSSTLICNSSCPE